MKRANYIPLPEVNEYTDAFQVQSLGLPVGFDESKLGFNVSAIEKAIIWGGLGQVTISAYDGEKRTTNISASSYTKGELTATGSTSETKPDLSSAKDGSISPVLQGDKPIDAIYYQKKDCSVLINSSERDQRILDKQKKWPRGPHDPNGQAVVLNDAIYQGLAAGIQNNHFHFLKKAHTGVAVVVSAMVTGASTLLEQKLTLPQVAENAAVMMNTMNLIGTLEMKQKTGLNVRERQWSFFRGVPFDRHMAARIHAGRTLVKALG